MTRRVKKHRDPSYIPVLEFGAGSMRAVDEALKIYRAENLLKLQDDIGKEKFFTTHKIFTTDPTATFPGCSQHIMIFSNLTGEKQIPHIHPGTVEGSQWRILLAISNEPIVASQKIAKKGRTEIIGRTRIPRYQLSFYIVDGNKTHWFGFDTSSSGVDPDAIAVVASHHLIDPVSTGRDPMRENTKLATDGKKRFRELIDEIPRKGIKSDFDKPADITQIMETAFEIMWKKAYIAYDDNAKPTYKGCVKLAEVMGESILERFGRDSVTMLKKDVDWMLR